LNERAIVAPSTLLADLVDTSQRVGAQASRRAKITAIADLLRKLAPPEIEIGVSYLAGFTRQGRSGVGYALIGDARPAAHAQRPNLTLIEVDATLAEIAASSGPGSVAARTRLLSRLFERATAGEQHFLERLLIGELRQGALEGIMIEAVAAAAGVPADAVRRAAKIGGGIVAIADRALRRGETGLAEYAIALFQPVAPMLAQPADDIVDAMTRLPMAAVEWKLDGARVQVHKNGNDVRIYTRTGNDVTAAAPEIVAVIRQASARTLILDGEAIALKQNGAPYPFQDTMRRFGRELDVDAMRATMPLSVFFFDCLSRDDENLAAMPIFEAWLAPFHDVGATTVATRNTGSTDHISFDRIGLPGFQFIQDRLDYFTNVHHSHLDTWDHAEPEDLKQAAAIVASFAYNAAMREQPFPRKVEP